MFKFPESNNEPLPYTEIYNTNGGRWVNVQEKKVSRLNLVLIIIKTDLVKMG